MGGSGLRASGAGVKDFVAESWEFAGLARKVLGVWAKEQRTHQPEALATGLAELGQGSLAVHQLVMKLNSTIHQPPRVCSLRIFWKLVGESQVNPKHC